MCKDQGPFFLFFFFFFYCLVENKHTSSVLSHQSRDARFWTIAGVAFPNWQESCPRVGHSSLLRACPCPYIWAVNLPSEAVCGGELLQLSGHPEPSRERMGCPGANAAWKVLFPRFLGLAPQLVACLIGFRAHYVLVL